MKLEIRVERWGPNSLGIHFYTESRTKSLIENRYAGSLKLTVPEWEQIRRLFDHDAVHGIDIEVKDSDVTDLPRRA